MAALLVGLMTVALQSQAELNPAPGRPGGPTQVIATPSPFDHEHAAWTAVLDQYVKDGTVDYRGLVDRGRPALDAYLSALSTGSSAESGWVRSERLAFWINAYNAYTIRLILDHFPLASIRSIGVLPLAAFRTRFIPLGAGRASISLNTIENDILAQFQDPRVHFSIVCASKSCPALRSEAYRASSIDQQLERDALAFVNDPSKNRWDASSRTLYLSSIFKWFRKDFERTDETLPGFVGRYLRQPGGAALPNGTRIVFLDYDWSLNGR
jgi:hypothetical protein